MLKYKIKLIITVSMQLDMFAVLKIVFHFSLDFLFGFLLYILYSYPSHETGLFNCSVLNF